MKLGFEESQSPTPAARKAPRMDGSLGQRMGLLPALRQCEDVAISEQQPARRFPLRIVQRGVRTQEPEGQVRREGRRWRLQDQMRASGGEQQSQPAADELRSQIARGRQSAHRAKALLRPRDHRRAKAVGRYRASRRLDRIEYPAEPRSRSSARFISCRTASFVPKELVLAEWQKTLFLRNESPETRGWLLDVMKCVELLGKRDFTLDEVYAFERHLGDLYPGNQNVKPKIRQQLQYLRDRGFIDFVSRGNYRLRS